jgi:DegV family protein with EDD domain
VTIRIVTDSTCDLPPGIIEQYRIAVIPLIITAGSEKMLDGVDITRKQFYARMPGYNPSAKTAAPAPAIFRATYERLAAEGADEILSIHISGKLSATIDNALAAASETTAARVTAFDSRQISLGTGFEAATAAHAAAQGHSLKEILILLEDQIKRTHVFAALDTLEYMRRGGRMNAAITALGTLLRIKPILKMYDGNPTAERTRTRGGAIRRLRDLVAQYAPYERAAIVHTGTEEGAQEFLERVDDLFPRGDIWIEEINPVIGAHIGPGVVGFAGISMQ